LSDQSITLKKPKPLDLHAILEYTKVG